MKFIISHDVDHISTTEHKNDLFIPKLISRSVIECMLGYINYYELIARIKFVFKGKLNNIDSLIEFDISNNVPSTYFVGVSNGLGLNYSIYNAKKVIDYIRHYNIDIGVHGISFCNYELICKEFNTFREITNCKSFGIRTHYLRNNSKSAYYFSKTGYLFNSSTAEFGDPYIQDNIYEFPIQLMDGNIFCNNSKWQSQTFNDAINNTLMLIDKANSLSLKYFTVVFHDIYFNDCFSAWKNWYIWFINYLINNRFQFISFKDAIAEIKKTNN